MLSIIVSTWRTWLEISDGEDVDFREIGRKYMTAPARYYSETQSLIVVLENHLLQIKLLIRLTSMPCKYLHANF
jgi:hypothetical protein